VGGKGIHTEFWWGNVLENIHVKDLEEEGIIILRCILGR
jgi:hypothetical protein